MALIEGTAGDDSLNGTPDDDTIIPRGGDDRLRGRAGDDVYRFAPGFGSDGIFETTDAAGAGADTIDFVGGIGRDDVRLFRDGGDRLFLELLGADGLATGDVIRVSGQYDADTEDPTPQVERVRFADGAEVDLTAFNTWLGTPGVDRLLGTSRDDVLVGGTGDDDLIGHAGDDLYRFAPGFGSDAIDEADGGFDTIAFQGGISAGDVRIYRGTAERLLLDVDDGSAEGQRVVVRDQFTAGNDLAPKVERVVFANGSDIDLRTFVDWRGTPGNDDLLGTNLADRLEGGAGNDALEGFAGNDTYVFGARFGRDTIVETADGGFDTVRFGSSFDVGDVSVERQFTLLVALARRTDGGSDRVTGLGTFDGPADELTLLVERIAFADGTTVDLREAMPVFGSRARDTITGTPVPDTIAGGAGNDTISGFRGADNLFGNGGSDTLNGSRGDDRVFGGNGEDTLDGGEGADLLGGGDGADEVAGGDGNDRLRGGEGNDVLHGEGGQDDLEGGRGFDTLTGGPGRDRLFGGPGRDELAGGSQPDTLNGEDGADVLRGGRWADRLFGGSGDDTLFGDAGADRLNGQRGEDRLIGGPGDDVFVVVQGQGRDFVRDFSDGDLVEFIGFAADAATIADRAEVTRNGDTAIDADLDGTVDVLLRGVTDFDVIDIA